MNAVSPMNERWRSLNASPAPLWPVTRAVDEVERAPGMRSRMARPSAAGPDGSLLVQTTIVGALMPASSSSVSRLRVRTSTSCRHNR